MRAHCIQHVPFEDMAAIEDWLISKKIEISYTKLYENTNFPDINSIDWLIVMGGPMSVNDEAEFPWIIKEKKFIKECIDKGKKIIGICLGSQFIASVLGSKVYRNKEKEIGWFPITKTNNTKSDIFNNLPDTLVVFHWHGETFDLPSGAELIASSEACTNQIFIYNKNVVGFQCHLETTAESLKTIDENCQSEIVPAKYIQNINQMEEGEKKYASDMHKALFGILENLLNKNH